MPMSNIIYDNFIENFDILAMLEEYHSHVIK